MIHVKILKQSDKTHFLDLSSSYTKYECYNLLLPNCLQGRHCPMVSPPLTACIYYPPHTVPCHSGVCPLPWPRGRGGGDTQTSRTGASTLFVTPRAARCKQLQPPSWSPSRVKSFFIYPYGRCRHVDICRLSGLQSRYFSLSRLQCTKSRSSVD